MPAVYPSLAEGQFYSPAYYSDEYWHFPEVSRPVMHTVPIIGGFSNFILHIQYVLNYEYILYNVYSIIINSRFI